MSVYCLLWSLMCYLFQFFLSACRTYCYSYYYYYYYYYYYN